MVRWTIVLGLTGFLCGFLGPIALAPDANQGPLLGLLITGPAGALLGAVLGAAVGLLGVPEAAARRALIGLAALEAGVVLYVAVPAPSFRADVVDAEMRGCASPASLRESALRRIEESSTHYRAPQTPVNWPEKFDRALAEDPGVVLQVRVSRRTRLYEGRAPWDLGKTTAKPWEAVDEEARYFARYRGADCAAYPAGTRTLLEAAGHVGIWPPSYLPEMLDVKVAAPPAADRARLLAAP